MEVTHSYSGHRTNNCPPSVIRAKQIKKIITQKMDRSSGQSQDETEDYFLASDKDDNEGDNISDSAYDHGVSNDGSGGSDAVANTGGGGHLTMMRRVLLHSS